MTGYRCLIIIFICLCIFSCSKSEPEGNGDTSTLANNAIEPANTDPLFSPPVEEEEEVDNDLAESDYNILFVGNSLTFVNDLPKLVRSRARAKGLTIGTRMIALPNYAIIDHWSDGDVQKEIESKIFDFVIVQQGPSSQAFGREVLIEYGKLYNALCKINEAKFGYFMVWPSLTYYWTFEGVITNHRDAANLNDAILCPVGEIWKRHFDATEDFDYYGPDGFHPSLKGSQVAAEVIVDTLFP